MSQSAADAPAVLMRDRVGRLSSQRVTWMKQLTELSRATTVEVARKKAAATSISGVAAIEMYPPLKGAFSAYATAQQSSASLLESLTAEHVDKRVQVPLQAYERMCVRPMQSMFADRDAAFLEARKAVETHNAIRLKSNTGTKLSTAEINSLAARRKAHNTHVLFEENSQLFEYKRVGDMKKWLQHIIMSEIAYHSACIEGLTQALQVAGQVDADIAMDAIRDQIMHPSITPQEREEAASAMSAPFTGIAVPPHLQPAASAGYSQAAVVALAGTSHLASSTAMTVPTLAQANILPETTPLTSARSQPQAPPTVSTTQTNFGPGAAQTLGGMPAPWATSPAGIAASGRNSPGALSSSPIAVPSSPSPAPMQPSTTVNAAAPPKTGLFGAMKSIGFGRAKSASPARGRPPAEPSSATTVDYSAIPPPSTT